MKVKFKQTEMLELYCVSCNFNISGSERELNSIAEDFNEECPKCDGSGKLFIR